MDNFDALPHDLRITAGDIIANISAEGYLLPSLHYEWDCKVVNSFTSQSFPVVNSVRLSYYEARTLRRMLVSKYFLAAIFQWSPPALTTFRAKELRTSVFSNDFRIPQDSPKPSVLPLPPRPKLNPNHLCAPSQPQLTELSTPLHPGTSVSAPNLYPQLAEQYI